jgi:hypothetical protein
MSSTTRFTIFVLVAILPVPLFADGWPQFGHDQQHSGNVPITAQPLLRVEADIVYDPFVSLEEIDWNGELLAHYSVPLVDGDDVFMEFKGGTYSGQASYQTQTWSIHRFHWENGKLVEKWTATSDWKPEPAPDQSSWEPLFHAVVANGFVYEPGAGGTLLQIDRNDGTRKKRINPFGLTVDPATFVAGPPAVDSAGNIYYTAVSLDPNQPWSADVRGAWLVRVSPDGSATTVPFSTIVTGAPRGADQCTYQFDLTKRPLPPSPTAVAPTIVCGSQRPAINAAPAIAPDGTVYIVTRAHFNPYWGYLVAVNPALTPKWSSSLRNRLHDGCGVLLRLTGPTGCRPGTTMGVDPDDNQPGSGLVVDNSSSSPVVAPDGSILYGAFTLYNDEEGHLVHFGADGTFLNSYQFGWDDTPAIYPHDGTYSIVTKENQYGQIVHPQPKFFITQLDPTLQVEWQVENTTSEACGRDPSGQIVCFPADPGFEWCVNAPAVDARGTVYVNSEDGYLYAIGQGGVIEETMFLQLALGAAYTPVSIGPDGRVYAQNAGHLFVISGRPRHRAVGH